MTTLEERVSFLEGAFAQFSERVAILATKDEFRAEIKASENGLRAEIKASELRIILWLWGAMVAVSALTVAAIKLIP